MARGRARYGSGNREHPRKTYCRGQGPAQSEDRPHRSSQGNKTHAMEMKKALASVGGTPPVLKEGVSKVVNLAAGIFTSMVVDTPVKNAIADFATENFEIASSNSLIFTATELGELKIASTCKAIFKEEIAMAKFLSTHLKEVNSYYLATLEDEETAPPKKSTRELKKRIPSNPKFPRSRVTCDTGTAKQVGCVAPATAHKA